MSSTDNGITDEQNEFVLKKIDCEHIRTRVDNDHS